MAKKDHTLLEAVELINQSLYKAEFPAELMLSTIEHIRKNPEMNLSEAIKEDFWNSMSIDKRNLVEEALIESAPYELQAEVMASTIDQIRKNPEIDLSVALQNGLQDWDI